MQPFTSKELYMMNGGQKLYIYKDGFGDVYNATAAEEADWAKQVIARAIDRLQTETNRVTLKSAINDLVYHSYSNLENLLKHELQKATPARQMTFAAALWTLIKYDKSFDIIHQQLLTNKAINLDDVFMSFDDLKDNQEARNFLISCLEGTDELLHTKAVRTISMWAWSGLPVLRDDNLLTLLQQPKYTPDFQTALQKVKTVFNISQ